MATAKLLTELEETQKMNQAKDLKFLLNITFGAIGGALNLLYVVGFWIPLLPSELIEFFYLGCIFFPLSVGVGAVVGGVLGLLVWRMSKPESCTGVLTRALPSLIAGFLVPFVFWLPWRLHYYG